LHWVASFIYSSSFIGFVLDVSPMSHSTGIQSLNHTIRTVVAAMSDEYWGSDMRQFGDDQLRPAYLSAMQAIVRDLGDGENANYRHEEAR
jgi:hypothetical protein